MKCLLCTKQGKPVPGIKIDIFACKTHTKIYQALEAQNNKRVYKDGQRVR